MIIVLRHAPPAEKMAGICYGQLEIPLAVDHAAAADRVVDRLVQLGYQPTDVISSDLQRCSGLAEQLLDHFPQACMAADARLRELDFGEWEGISWDELQLNDGERLDSWMSDWLLASPPAGESLPELEQRVFDFCDELDHEGRLVLLVAHAGSIRALRRYFQQDPLDWPELMNQPVEHLAVELLVT